MFKTEIITPIDALNHWVKTKPDAVYLSQPIGDEVIEYTWSRVLQEVSCVANYLSRFPPGSHIAIISLNCAHWIMTDLAIQMAGHVSIPIYPTASKATVEQILQHSESKAVFVGKMFDPEAVAHLIPSEYEQIAIYNEYSSMQFWGDIVSANQPMKHEVIPKSDDLISIIYTSGTTGDPKGVMVSYAAVSAAMQLIKSVVKVNEQDRFVSYLPLAHVAERMAVEVGSIMNGAHVSFIRSLDTFSEDVKTAAPTIFFGVPRIWTKIKMAIEAKLGGAKVLNVLLKLPLLGGLLKRQLLKKLGFHDVRFALCAAAAVNQDVLRWYANLGLKLNEAYGMSETCGLSHMTLQSDTKTGSVGRAIKGCECKLSDSGEVCLRNPAMMQGYFKQTQLTDEVIDSAGWLHTGDLGVIDDEGFLYITGRMKDIFKTSKGKYIAPSAIETKFQSVLGLEHVILMGNGFSQPFIVVSTHETMYADNQNELIELGERILPEVNATLEAQEKVSHMFISSLSWSSDNGLLTPTLKMVRNNIEQQYQDKAEKLMTQSSSSVMKLE